MHLALVLACFQVIAVQITSALLTDPRAHPYGAVVGVDRDTRALELTALRLKGEGLIPSEEGVNMAGKITEPPNPGYQSYKIIFNVPENFRGKENDFDSYISEFISQFTEGDN